MKKELKNFIIKDAKKFELKKHSTSYQGELDKIKASEITEALKEKLHLLQEKLYADGSKSILIVLQAMDAAGKDSLIEHVFGGVNPQGCDVTSFKSPSSKEYSHDFLWRHYIALPAKGKIGIFNRSHYENVLVCKVHPEYNLSEKVWKDVKDFDKKFWQNRYDSINNFEKHLSENGTKIIKIFLNVSKKEQKQRFLDRINEENKNWKFSSADVSERQHWSDYMKAYQEAIQKTSTDHAPWHVIPADKKWFSRYAALHLIVNALEEMDLSFPKLSEDAKKDLENYRQQLEQES